MCKLYVFVISFLSSIFLHAYEIKFSGGQYKVAAVEGELKKAVCQYENNVSKTSISLSESQKTFPQKALDQMLTYLSANCFLKSESEKCPMHFDEIQMISLDKTKLCRRPDVVLSCNSAVTENCIQKKIDFYKERKCLLEEVYRKGQSGIVQKTDFESGQKYNRMIDMQTVYLKSPNCMTITEKETCPMGYEMRLGFNHRDEINKIDEQVLAENYCLKTIVTTISRKNKTPSIDKQRPILPDGSTGRSRKTY